MKNNSRTVDEYQEFLDDLTDGELADEYNIVFNQDITPMQVEDDRENIKIALLSKYKSLAEK